MNVFYYLYVCFNPGPSGSRSAPAAVRGAQARDHPHEGPPHDSPVPGCTGPDTARVRVRVRFRARVRFRVRARVRVRIRVRVSGRVKADTYSARTEKFVLSPRAARKE